MVIRESSDSPWKVIGALQEGDLDVDNSLDAEGKFPAHVEAPDPNPTDTPTQPLSGVAPLPHPDPDTLQGKKRCLLNSSPSTDGPSSKRSRTSETSFDSSQKACLAPVPHPSASPVLAQGSTQTLGAGDIFLSGEWRKRWCRCDLCLPGLRKHPYLLEEEETYEPPEDPDSRELSLLLAAGTVNNSCIELSLEELGLRALDRIPRDRALDGIRAFNTMRYAGDHVP